MQQTNNQNNDHCPASAPQEEYPVPWMSEKGVDEVLFCEELLEQHPMKCIGGVFIGLDGTMTEPALKRLIYNTLKPYIHKAIPRLTDQLLSTLAMEAYCEGLTPDQTHIHVANGTYHLAGCFSEKKRVCLNRLPVTYDPDAPAPEKWIGFLGDLLYPEDIPTLQEYMGYSLLPTNRAQRMLLMIGKGGEGKSRVGLVLRALLGDNMNVTSIQKIEKNAFARADLQNRLLMVDDDMKVEALPDTNNIKTIVTLEGKMDLERKNRQSEQGILYCRIMGFGNGTLSSLYDHSDGFWRRQIILSTKDKDPDREDDPFLIDKLTKELPGILNWCIAGLERLIVNDFKFTISERTAANLKQAKEDGNNIIPFMHSDGYIRRDASCRTSSKDLYSAYIQWCDDNAEKPMTAKSFTSFLISRQGEYGIHYTSDILSGGRRVRGFIGVESLIRSPY